MSKRYLSNIDYTDTGCHKHPRCLSCPLLRCIFDVEAKPPTKREQIQALLKSGLPDYSVAQELTTSLSYVQRIQREST